MSGRVQFASARQLCLTVTVSLTATHATGHTSHDTPHQLQLLTVVCLFLSDSLIFAIELGYILCYGLEERVLTKCVVNQCYLEEIFLVTNYSLTKSSGIISLTFFFHLV